MIKKYVKKPVVVEAILYTGSRKSFAAAQDFLGTPLYREDMNNLRVLTIDGGFTYVPTKHYLVRDADGGITSVDPDIFKAHYSEVLGETE